MKDSKILGCEVCGTAFSTPFGISAVCSGPLEGPHPATTMVWWSPKANHSAIDYSIMAWDISDAIALVPNNNIDIGMDAIEPNLPAFIEACLATQAELDKKEARKNA